MPTSASPLLVAACVIVSSSARVFEIQIVKLKAVVTELVPTNTISLRGSYVPINDQLAHKLSKNLVSVFPSLPARRTNLAKHPLGTPGHA